MMASTTAADDVHGPGVGKKDTAGGGAPGAVRPPEQGLKCPRCDSPNTKFCYYNNYSLAQPRYFCKTCRRYWTKGGALRNVPVGGGCRKSKKSKASSSTAPSAAASSRLSSSEGPAQELRLYQLGIPTAVDFHLGGGGGLPFSRLHHPSAVPGVFGTAAADGAAASHLISFGDLSCAAAALPAEAAGATAAPLIGFSYPIQAVAPPPFADVGIGGGGDASTSGSTMSSMHSNLAASIESLSSINQGLHWKLQQQRLATFYGGDPSQQQHRGKGGSCDAAATATLPMSLLEGPSRPTSCQMTASSKDICVTGAASAGGVSRKGSMVGDASSSAAEWFLDNPTTYTTPHAHGSLNSSGSATSNNWSGVQTWSDMHQFSALP